MRAPRAVKPIKKEEKTSRPPARGRVVAAVCNYFACEITKLEQTTKDIQ